MSIGRTEHCVGGPHLLVLSKWVYGVVRAVCPNIVNPYPPRIIVYGLIAFCSVFWYNRHMPAKTAVIG